MTSWLRFWVLTSCCLLVLMGARGCDPEPVTPSEGTGGYGDTPAVGGSGGWENPFTGGTAGTGGMVCDAIERSGQPRALKPRVVGGDDAQLGAFPWVCSIQTASGWHYCGGSLIEVDQVLTAAHCSVDAGDYVLCGRTVLSGSGGELRAVAAVRSNAGWYATTSGNDVALLRLDVPITTIQPVLMGIVGDGPIYVLGWGRTTEGGPAADHLQIAEVDRQSCAPYGDAIDDTMLCASAPGRDGCSGDSGGPLLQSGKVIGITSWGNGCARPGYPGVYTDVGAMLPWLETCRW